MSNGHTADRTLSGAGVRSGRLPDGIVDEIRELLAGRTGRRSEDPQLEALRSAILIEDLTGQVLTDDQINPDRLATEEQILDVVRSLRGTR